MELVLYAFFFFFCGKKVLVFRFHPFLPLFIRSVAVYKMGGREEGNGRISPIRRVSHSRPGVRLMNFQLQKALGAKIDVLLLLLSGFWIPNWFPFGWISTYSPVKVDGVLAGDDIRDGRAATLLSGFSARHFD